MSHFDWIGIRLAFYLPAGSAALQRPRGDTDELCQAAGPIGGSNDTGAVRIRGWAGTDGFSRRKRGQRRAVLRQPLLRDDERPDGYAILR